MTTRPTVHKPAPRAPLPVPFEWGPDPDTRLWSSAERQEARRQRRLAAHDAAIDEITHGRKAD